MHSRQWVWGIRAWRREPEQGLRDGAAVGSAALMLAPSAKAANSLAAGGWAMGGRPGQLAGGGVGGWGPPEREVSPKRDRGRRGDGSSWRGENPNQFAAGRLVAGRATD